MTPGLPTPPAAGPMSEVRDAISFRPAVDHPETVL